MNRNADLIVKMLCALGVLSVVELASAQEPQPMSIPWNLEQLSVPPKAHSADMVSEPGLEAVFLEGLPWKGNPTRFFAWYAVPEPSQPGQRVPGIVLVHGGGGTAHSRWVRQWVARGYAAIAIDTNGNMPPPGKTGEGPPEPIRNPTGGPNGSDHCFNQLDEPVEDQWAYHAVSNIVLANSFLRQLPGVDANRIGLTGISWGGYLTCIAVGVDPRFRFAVPVYGCGFLADDSGWAQRFADMGSQKTARWKELWDPANHLPRATLPMLWINGDMDDCFSLKIMRQSFRLPTGQRYLSIQPNMGHSHTRGEAPPEIPAFADMVVRGGAPLARCESQGIDGNTAWAKFVDVSDVAQARCAYTTDSGRWIGRKWMTVDAQWDSASRLARHPIPDGATAFYFVLTDGRDLMCSSEPTDLHVQ